jgi:Sec-independent protein secretion pathway component TatC
MLAVPMWMLFEVGLLASRAIIKRREVGVSEAV